MTTENLAQVGVIVVGVLGAFASYYQAKFSAENLKKLAERDIKITGLEVRHEADLEKIADRDRRIEATEQQLAERDRRIEALERERDGTAWGSGRHDRHPADQQEPSDANLPPVRPPDH